MEYQLKFENEFRDYEHFCEVLVQDIFTRHKLFTELENIQYIDGMSDVGRRVYVQTNETEYMIRTWNVYDTDMWVYVDYTLNKQLPNGEYETI
jgi:hypothetical protein